MKKQSIRWRIVGIYSLLVFMAMAIVSVFLVNRIEKYQLSSLQQNIESMVSESNLLGTLGKYDDLSSNAEDIKEYIVDGFSYGLSQEISVVDDNLNIIASTNENLVNRNASGIFDIGLITNVIANKEARETNTNTSENIAVLNKCYPIVSEKSKLSGVLYVRADMTSIMRFTNESRGMFVQATLIALIATVLLGILLARGITEPINKVTETAEKMAQGDFNTEVPVKSNDEIGQLAQMFNLMQGKLDTTISEVKDERNKLVTILKNMADGLIAVSLDGEILHINPAARKMLGVHEDDAITDYTYESLLGHLSRELDFEKVLARSKEGEEELNFDYGGLTFAVRYDRFATDENESASGIIILLQDITERQKLEDMQTDFVANVSHELKTPLATVKAYTETLMDGGVDPETTDHFLEIINSEADRMNRLVKDLLQLSRLDHSQEKWNIKEGNIISLLNSCVEKMVPIANQKGQQLNALFEEDSDIRVSIDKDRMEQVILNIISNAVKYTEEDGRIDVDALTENGTVKIIVQDNGIGIPEDQLPRIFERFFRVDKARSRAMGSSGLGLAITKQIIEEHHGSIEAFSTVGKGTRMVITLPLANRRGRANIE